MEQHIIYVGLDVHKDTIAVAFAEAGKRGEVREHGKVLNTPAAVKTLAIKLAREYPKDGLVLCNLSGRGDKDVHTIAAREGIEL